MLPHISSSNTFVYFRRNPCLCKQQFQADGVKPLIFATLFLNRNMWATHQRLKHDSNLLKSLKLFAIFNQRP